jgi:hypothetical protein
MSDRDALQILADRSGTMYDPRVVDAFFAFHQFEPSRPAPPAVSEAAANTPQPDIPAQPINGTHDLHTFFRLGRALSNSFGAASLAETLHGHLQPHLPPATLVVHAYDQDRRVIVAVGEAGSPPSGIPPGTAITLPERLSGWVAATGQSIVNCDPRLDLDELARETSPFRSALVVQVLSTDGSPLGVLSLFATRTAAFSEADARLMTAVASVLGAHLGTLDTGLGVPGRGR